MEVLQLDDIDRNIINSLQGGFPICDNPYAEAAANLSLDEHVLIERLDRLIATGAISRFGPLYNAERIGGAVTLAALSVPEKQFEQVAAQVNAHAEVAHNYERDHTLNMWFVISVEKPEQIETVIGKIAAETGLEVLNMPKLDEFFIGLKVEV